MAVQHDPISLPPVHELGDEFLVFRDKDLSPVQLRFHYNFRLEEYFLHYYFTKYHSSMRRGFALWMVVFFVYLCALMIAQLEPFVAILTQTVIMLGIAGIGYFISNSTYAAKYGQQTSAFVVVANSLTMSVYTTYWDPEFYVTNFLGVLIIVATSATVLRQRFVYSLFSIIPVVFIVLIHSLSKNFVNIVRSPLWNQLVVLLAGVLILSLYASRNREYWIRRGFITKLRQMQEERNATNLLCQVLPESIVPELRQGRKYIATKHSSVVVLFARTPPLSPARSL